MNEFAGGFFREQPKNKRNSLRPPNEYGHLADSIRSHRNFSTKHNLGVVRVVLLSDAGHEVLEAFGAWRMKKSYGREYMGVVRSTVLIDPKGIVRHVWPEVKAAGHAAGVLSRLAELASKQK